MALGGAPARFTAQSSRPHEDRTMTVTPERSPGAGGSSRRRWIGVVVAVIVVLGILALAATVWYIYFRPAGPPPVGTEAPLIPESWLSGPGLLALATSIAM
jgi:hypothetical protein